MKDRVLARKGWGKVACISKKAEVYHEVRCLRRTHLTFHAQGLETACGVACTLHESRFSLFVATSGSIVVVV